MLGDHCCPKARHRKSSSGHHCDGLYIRRNPKWEVSGANPWQHWCGLFGNGLGVCAHGYHFLMDLVDGKANAGRLRVQSLAALMRILRQKPQRSFDPLANLIQIGLIVQQNPKREVSGGKSPGRMGMDLTAIASGTWAPAIIVMDFGGRLHRKSLKCYSGHARSWTLPTAWMAKQVGSSTMTL
jgi:hypothetical protein